MQWELIVDARLGFDRLSCRPGDQPQLLPTRRCCRCWRIRQFIGCRPTEL